MHNFSNKSALLLGIDLDQSISSSDLTRSISPYSPHSLVITGAYVLLFSHFKAPYYLPLFRRISTSNI